MQINQWKRVTPLPEIRSVWPLRATKEISQSCTPTDVPCRSQSKRAGVVCSTSHVGSYHRPSHRSCKSSPLSSAVGPADGKAGRRGGGGIFRCRGPQHKRRPQPQNILQILNGTRGGRVGPFCCRPNQACSIGPAFPLTKNKRLSKRVPMAAAPSLVSRAAVGFTTTTASCRETALSVVSCCQKNPLSPAHYLYSPGLLCLQPKRCTPLETYLFGHGPGKEASSAAESPSVVTAG